MENWIEINKEEPNRIPNESCWVFNSRTNEVEFSKKGIGLPCGIYTHYQKINKPASPNL